MCPGLTKDSIILKLLAQLHRQMEETLLLMMIQKVLILKCFFSFSDCFSTPFLGLYSQAYLDRLNYGLLKIYR